MPIRNSRHASRQTTDRLATVIRQLVRATLSLGILAAALRHPAIPESSLAAAEPSATAGPAASKYRLTDPELKVVHLDSSPNESFLSIKVDPMGRVFVGGREALFVYEPRPDGSYAARQELCRFPKDSWVYDIEFRGNDLYILTLSALYVVPDGVVSRSSIKPRKLIWGPPDWHVHQAFHGLAWGPEGDLYLSMGDLLVWYGDFNRPDHWGHWTMFSQPPGTRTPYTGVGAFFRCRPDGSQLSVVAGGTRNSCGLVFDSQWNLFSNDNDHEGLPTEYVPGRLLHVVPEADFAWPRGWSTAITPDRADLLQTMNDKLGRYVPVGQTYYDEDYLPERYRNNLLVARWGRRQITRHPIQPRGASFSADEHVVLEGVDTTRPVGVAVGRGGRIFATLSYMAHNEGSPVYPSDLIMITRANDPDSHPFTPIDLVAATPAQLNAEFASDSSWRARRAHNEWLRRWANGNADGISATLPDLQTPVSLAIRQIWLFAAQRGRHAPNADPNDAKANDAKDALLQLAGSNGSQTRLAEPVVQAAIHAAAEFFPHEDWAFDLFVRSLESDRPQVQLAAIDGLFRTSKLDGAKPLPAALVAGPARGDDTYLRQLATLLLARKAPESQLVELLGSSDARTRLAGVLATGFRLTSPIATSPLDSELPLQPWQNEDPYVVEYWDETVDLRKHGRLGVFTTAEHWRSREKSPPQERLFALLRQRLDDPAESVRLQATHFLGLLKDDRAEPLIARVRQQSERERLAHSPLTNINELWIAGPFADGPGGFDTAHSPEKGAIDLNATYESAGRKVAWEKVKPDRMFNFRKRFGDTAGQSVYAYFRLESPRAQQAMLLPGSDDGLVVWCNGRQVFKHDVERGGLPLQDIVFLDLQIGGNDVLIRVRNRADEHNLYLHYRSLAGSAAWSLPEKFDERGLADRLKSATTNGDAKVPETLLGVDWLAAARQGDPARGRKLFGRDGIGCVKCHGTSAEPAQQGGPSLAAAGSRFTVPYLVESILLPHRQVSPIFRATTIVTTGGKTLTGLVVSETADKLELLTGQGERIMLGKPEIDERKVQDLSPMPSGLIKSPEELRDILAFLTREG